MKNFLFVSAALMLRGAPSLAADSAAGAAGAPAVSASTAATVAGLYDVERMRDPFARWGAGHGGARSFSLENFSIHKLSLRGVMKDAASQFALFADQETGASFLLRQGRLYDERGKIVPGVGGVLNVKRKTATLTSTDGDAQVFHLGTDERE